jgi:hypothetical protein
MTRRPAPLTVQNAAGNGVPATADLVTVQGFLNQAIAALGTDMGGRVERMEERLRKELTDGRVAHQIEHRELLDSLDAWKSAQEQNCTDRMAPYENVDRVLRVLNWIGCHRKQAAAAFTFALTTIVAVAALAGGFFEAP